MSEPMSNKRASNIANTYGHIDSASITQVVQAFDVYPRESVPQGWDIPLFATSLLISARNIGLAPGISRTKILSEGPIGDVTRKLLSSGIMARRKPSLKMREKTFKEIKERIHTYSSEFGNKFESLMRKDKIIGWLDWSRHRAFVEHFQNYGTLVDEQFVPEITLISNIGQNDVKNLHKETSRQQVVKALSEQESITDFSDKVSRCFLVAALLRAMYHDKVAGIRRQVAHHPIRCSFLSELNTQPLLFGIPRTEAYLSRIVLHDALIGERKFENRLNRWVENIKKLRDANEPLNAQIDLRTKENPELAFKEAVRAANVVGISCIPRDIVDFLPKSLGVIVGKGFEVILTPFIGVSATITGEIVENYAEHLTRRGLQKLYTSRHHLARLAKSPPGRLSFYKRTFPI